MTPLYVLAIALLGLWVLRTELRRLPSVRDQWSRFRGVMHLREERRREPTIDTARLVQDLKHRRSSTDLHREDRKTEHP